MPALRSSARSEEVEFSRLKELVKKLGGVLVLNGDEPEFVILSYEQYQKNEAGEEVPLSTTNNNRNGFVETNGRANEELEVDDEEQRIVERLNHEILALKEEIRQKEEAELVEDEQSTEPATETVDFD